MTVREMQIEFERRVQTFNKEALANEKFTSDTIIAYLNEAIDKFYKTRYSGMNTKRTGFEEDQKRTDDLRMLVNTMVYSQQKMPVGVSSDKEYFVYIPDNYAFHLGDAAGIIPIGVNDCWPKQTNGDYEIKYTDVLESSLETIDRQKADSLSEYHLKYCTARPLRLIQSNKIYLYTDGNYAVTEYKLTYLRRPTVLSTNDLTSTEQYKDFPPHAHLEIVKIAVELYMATKPAQNYSAYAGEVQTME